MGTRSAKALGLDGAAIKKAQMETHSPDWGLCRHHGPTKVTPSNQKTKGVAANKEMWLGWQGLGNGFQWGGRMRDGGLGGGFIHAFFGKQNSKIRALYNPQHCEYDGFESWIIPVIRLCYMVQLTLRKGGYPGLPWWRSG